ncbi:MAG: MFS transporter [Proteobacteria bacterium]|nr:MAG: MFS transporter [Pseudomonadota bacterium]
MQGAPILRILTPFGLGYFVSYLFRVVNAVIADAMSRELSLDASALGLLTSIYFATFAAFQLPLGILLDRFGPRRVESVLLMFAAAGALTFSLTESVGGLIVGRALIGLGVSACLMSAFIAYRRWFDAARLPLVNGVQMAFGGLGALAGTRPSAMIMEASDWRTLFLILAGLTVAVALLIWFVVPRREPHAATAAGSGGGFGKVFRDRFFWRFAPAIVFSQAAFLSIQSLWIGTWLRDVADMPVLEASNIMAMTTIAMVAGFLLLGMTTSRLARLGVPVPVSASLGMSLFLVPQAALIAGGFDLPLLFWILFGFFGTSGIIGYSAISQHFPVHIAGRANTAVNFMVFVMAFVEQWGLGIVINQFPGDTGYSPLGYQVAMGIAFTLQALGVGWYALSARRG